MPPHHTDLSTLNALFKGDRARVTEWVELYLEEAPGYFKNVENGLAAHDTKALACAVHELRPQAHYLGAPKLLELLVVIGKTAQNEGAEACSATVAELLSVAERIELELREHLRSAEEPG